jgi:hypothetical protein
MTYDPRTLNNSGLWRTRIQCVRALSAIEDAIQGMLCSADDNRDDPTSRAYLTGAQRSIRELMRHLDENYVVNNVIDGQGRGSLYLKEDSACLLD